MELEVRAVAGVENCHVSLPLSLLQTLESTHPDHHLPHFLPLQLRSLSVDRLWHVAWCGSSSSSPAIEIAQEFAACIGLPDGTIVQVRALPNVPKASLVTIEPLTEDDWEVVELNAQSAEAAILNQVRIIQGNMTFPLWLHGHRIVTFTVVSLLPDRTVVQLVPGAEVAVAPKRRRKSADQCEDSSLKSLDGSNSFQKALLRVQDPKNRLILDNHLKGGNVGIELTSIVLIHPETAKMFLFDSLHVVVILPRQPLKMKVENTGNISQRKQPSSEESKSRYVIVRLVFSESVAKGHIMISQSLCRYLRVSFHSWIYMQRYANDLKKDAPSFSLSPSQFMPYKNSQDPQQNGAEVLDDSLFQEDKPSLHQSSRDMGGLDCTSQEELISTLFDGLADTAKKESGFPFNAKERLKGLLYSWIEVQFHGITSMAGVKATSLVLGPTTFLRFKLTTSSYVSGDKWQSSTDNLTDAKMMVQSVNEILYALNASGESLPAQKYSAYELAMGDQVTRVNDVLRILSENLSMSSFVSYDTCKDRVFNQITTSTISSLSWMGIAASDVINRLTLLLSPACGTWLSNLNLPLPGHVLVYGPPGSGKTVLASAAAKSLEENKDILVHTVFIPCSALAVEKVTSIRQMLCDYLSDALDNAPSVIIFDDLDSIITSSSDAEGSQPSASVVVLTEFITGIMDEYGEKRKQSCSLGPLAFIACVRELDNIPQSLRSSGRFDFHIQLPAPSTSERLAILRHEIQKRSLQCSEDVLLDVASKCDGYDAYDLGILVDRSVHAAIGRFLPSQEAVDRVNPSLIADDFAQARQDFLPVSMRDITKSPSEGGRVGWEDIGGLSDVRDAVKEMIELPSKFPNIFGKSPLRMRSNVLLYGPPGCGKTHFVGAAAAASSLRFISIKGPELLNKYIGASEQAVRDVFSKAAAAAPCLLFFDEFDSIAPKRGHDNTGVTDRVVNQFLTELDGVEVLSGVFVFAATSRPDLLDAALLRPGRLDRLLFCDFPSLRERSDILRVLSRKLALADNVDFNAIAYMTEGFSGADLQALLSDAQLAAVQELLDSGYDGKSGEAPIITDELLKSIASKAKPSVSESEKERLYAIYNQFLDAKRSVGAQSRDAKGKRATLA
ncbi:peroxisome biogenesis protein 1-like isoform X1 [Chenopodium quinoa]|uniref:peroxisome biogenesis protein 1-like isoform X1 n=1 Tax=Chenopodium quinoa TaxID=63459 RepID=UPI000B78D5B8|nr:peroxisome biogenesis protein 1-like isoform X1 [Chenopodium quinoa]